MKYPKPKYKIKDKIIVDNCETATIKDAELFRKNRKISWSYQITDTILSGFWVDEDRIKLK